MANYIHQVFLKGCLQVYNMHFSSVITFCFVEDVFYKRQQLFFLLLQWEDGVLLTLDSPQETSGT